MAGVSTSEEDAALQRTTGGVSSPMEPNDVPLNWSWSDGIGPILKKWEQQVEREPFAEQDGEMGHL